MGKKDRLHQLIEHYSGGNKAKFAAKIGVKPQTLSMWLARGTLDYDVVFTHCEHLNGEWLITGEGEMIKGGPHKHEDTTTAASIVAEPETGYMCSPRRPDNQLLDIIRQQAEEIGQLKERLRVLKAAGNHPPNG